MVAPAGALTAAGGAHQDRHRAVRLSDDDAGIAASPRRPGYPRAELLLSLYDVDVDDADVDWITASGRRKRP